MPSKTPRKKRKLNNKLATPVPWTAEQAAKYHEVEAARHYARAEAYREAMLILTHQMSPNPASAGIMPSNR